VAEIPLASNLANPAALAGLFLVIPIILLYLLRPKPKEVLFPSTMFIRFIERNKRFTSFLERFIRDPILLIQLFMVFIIVLAVANPFYSDEYEERGAQSIAIVVDVSASMQSTDVSPSRFAQAIYEAKSIISQLNRDDDVSIVIASTVPSSAAARLGRQEAALILDTIAVHDTPSSIGDSILLAKDLLVRSDRRKKVYVLSDFGPSSGIDPLAAKKLCAAEGVEVELLKVGVRGYNAGIVSLSASRNPSNRDQLFMTALVRNYHPHDVSADFKVFSDETLIHSRQLFLRGDSEEFIVVTSNMSSSASDLTVEIDSSDDFAVDDKAYARLPENKPKNILLLSSQGGDKFLRLMLGALQQTNKIKLTEAFPPVIPDISGYDVIILGDVHGDNVLPGTFRDIHSRVEDGVLFIVMGSKKLDTFTDEHLWYHLPIDMIGHSERESDVEVMIEHDILYDVTFSTVLLSKYLSVTPRDNETVTVLQAKASATPLMSFKRFGKGTVVYLGIDSSPERSNFYYTSDFPIFWNQMIEYFKKDFSSLSVRGYLTGEYLILPGESVVTTPSGAQVRARAMYLDNVGIYRVGSGPEAAHVPVNLFSVSESNTTGAKLEDLNPALGYKVEYERREIQVELFKYLIFFAIIILSYEAVLYRRRGLI
jgi:hypothetical protein